MGKNIIIFLFIVLVSAGSSFSQDNILGDDFIYSLQKNISLDLESARLIDVLKMLSQETGLNFISTEAVRDRSLTLYMEDVPLREAMDTIFKANNLAYDYYPDSNIFVLKEMGRPAVELKVKVYHLKYARVLSSRFQKEIDDIISSDNEEEGAAEDDEEDFGIKAAVENVLSELGRISEDPVTNSLIVVDVPSQFPIINKVVNELDIPPLKVMIEVEMLDVSKTHLDKIGFNFGTKGLYSRFAGPARSTSFPFPESLLKGGIAQSTGGALTPPILGILDLTSLTAMMQFLTEDTSSKILARPKILTLSNETAEVNLTSNEAIGVTTTITDGGQTEEVEREDTGTRLRVTPQVNPYTREITLIVEVFNRESIDSGIVLNSMSDGQVKNIEERSTKNVLRLKDNETLLIGGLIKKEDKETIRKIPLLGDIPFIGRLFRYVERPSTDNLDRELMVFLTPHILKEKPLLTKEKGILQREQVDFLKERAVRLALERFGK